MFEPVATPLAQRALVRGIRIHGDDLGRKTVLREAMREGFRRVCDKRTYAPDKLDLDTVMHGFLAVPYAHHDLHQF